VLALAIVVAAYVLSFFQRFAPAGIAPDLVAAFNTTASSLGVLAATYFYVYTLMQVPTGILVDTLGPRLILLLGGLVSVAPAVCCSAWRPLSTWRCWDGR
jgi:sugar phosphate permease